MSIPFLKGTVFDALILTYIIVGWPRSAIAMSAKDRCAVGSYTLLDDTVVSPVLIKPKKQSVEAGQIIM